jgi:hypothetical protein
VFKVNVRTDSAGQWLRSSILHLVEEAVSGRVGSEVHAGQALGRRCSSTPCGAYVNGLPEHQNGWLRVRAIRSSAAASRSCTAVSRILDDCRPRG